MRLGAAETSQIQRKGRRGWPQEVRESVQGLYNQDPQPTWAQMVRDLKQEFGEFNAPGESTLRDWERRAVITKDDLDAPWLFLDAEDFPAEDAALVFPIERHILRSWAVRNIDHPPSPRFLTRRVAQGIVRVRRAAPELDPANVWHVSLILAIANHVNDEWGPLVHEMLTLAPWLDDGSLLDRAVHAGLVSDDAVFVFELAASWAGNNRRDQEALPEEPKHGR